MIVSDVATLIDPKILLTHEEFVSVREIISVIFKCYIKVHCVNVFDCLFFKENKKYVSYIKILSIFHKCGLHVIHNIGLHIMDLLNIEK